LALVKNGDTDGEARRGYAYLFNEAILQAGEGYDFDFMHGKRKE
jgi:dihydroxy-acid dehydratase